MEGGTEYIARLADPLLFRIGRVDFLSLVVKIYSEFTVNSFNFFLDLEGLSGSGTTVINLLHRPIGAVNLALLGCLCILDTQAHYSRCIAIKDIG